tara:strand:- start:1228 stop:2118 length:891 start_codon:yes stop_codon:yes gene_type:complete
MATGNYGVVRPADVSTTDIEILYSYTPNRNAQPGPLRTLDAESLMDRFPSPIDINGQIDLLPGLYNLNLPANVFSEKGIYNIIIRPREYRVIIQDCGVLSSSPDIKGIVLDTSQLPPNLSVDNNLIGYRIEYYENSSKVQNLFRIVTSNGTVEAVNQNLSNTSQKAIRYRYTDNSNLVFCTLTPTSSPLTQPNKIPFIGSAGQVISLTNTYFNPVFLEIEMTEYDLETLSYGIYGNQTKSIQDGKYTIYDNGNTIYKQYNLYEIQDDTGNPLYEVRELVTDDEIDFTKDFNNITNV